jgi:hypothetical protein
MEAVDPATMNHSGGGNRRIEEILCYNAILLEKEVEEE